MPVPGPGYAITARVEVPASASAAGDLTVAIGQVGGVVTAFDVVESHTATLVVDISCNALNEGHGREITDALEALSGVRVRKVSDRTFLLHLGGKLEVQSKVALRTRDDLSRAYTPGVARVCQAIAANPDDARRLTIKRNTVAVVTDGSAVLGLGNLGAAAAMPVMEGKAALFKRFGGVDAWPVCLDTQDTEEIIRTVQILAPGYGGINLEDIAAPAVLRDRVAAARAARHPGLPRRPARHRGGGARRAAQRPAGGGQGAHRLPDRRLRGGRRGIGDHPVAGVVEAGGGAAPSTSTGSCTRTGPGSTTTWPGSPSTRTRERIAGTLADALVGADVFIGVSAPNLFGAAELATMADRAIVFALANPDPEVDPGVAARHAAVVATGRSDYPNQINNVLAFPGIFRGLLDAQARDITDAMLLAASTAIADVVTEPNPSFIVPSVFDPAVAKAVADGGAGRGPGRRHVTILGTCPR